MKSEYKAFSHSCKECARKPVSQSYYNGSHQLTQFHRIWENRGMLFLIETNITESITRKILSKSFKLLCFHVFFPSPITINYCISIKMIQKHKVKKKVAEKNKIKWNNLINCTLCIPKNKFH